MIQTNTPRRIDGRDTDGERWVALAAWLTQQIEDAA